MYTGHLRFTTLMQVVDQAAGRANFVFAHPFMYVRSISLVSSHFRAHANYAFVKVTFRVTQSTRWILAVTQAEVDFSRFIGDDFAQSYATTLYNECVAFDNSDIGRSFADDHAFQKAKLEYFTRVSTTTVSPSETPAVETPAVETPEKTPLSYGIEKVDGGYWLNKKVFVDSQTYDICQASFQIARSGSPITLLMTGPSGYGKTSIPEEFASVHEMNFIRMNCAQVRDPEEWFGYREAKDGSTVFVPSEFTQAITAGNCVVVLDEFNRVEPWLHNTLYPLLDHAAKTSIHGEMIKCGKNVIFFATANLGYQYVGTFQLDAAIMNRMDAVIKVGCLPSAVEEKLLVARFSISAARARTIVKVLSKLRELAISGNLSADVSTRTSLKIARFCSVDVLPLEAIFKAVVFSSLNEAELKSASDAVAYLF